MLCPGLPPELWHRIITIFLAPRCIRVEDLDSDTLRDLKSCSLVSEALLFPAQSVLFRDIDLRAWADEELTYCQRLAAIFAESSHLAAHVKTLVARPDAAIFSLVSKMRLSQLRDIQLEKSGDSGDIEGPALELIETVMGESVHIHSVQFCDFSRLSYSTVVRILEKAPSLDRLDFLDCTPHEDQPLYSSDLPTSTRRKITQLSLERSPDIAKWLIHPAFPLDLTGLIYVDVRAAATVSVAVLLQTAQETMDCLEFMAGTTVPPQAYHTLF